MARLVRSGSNTLAELKDTLSNAQSNGYQSLHTKNEAEIEEMGPCNRFCCFLFMGCWLSQIICHCDPDETHDYFSRICKCALINGPLYIAALIIGFNFECDSNNGVVQIYNTEIMSPNTYLIIAGFFGIVDIFCTARWKYDIKSLNDGAVFSHCCSMGWDTSWCIVGSVLFVELDTECQRSPVGLMIFAYIIIKWIFTGCRFIFIIAGCTASEDPVLIEHKKYFEETMSGSMNADDKKIADDTFMHDHSNVYHDGEEHKALINV